MAERFSGYGMPEVDFGFINQAVNQYDKSRLGAQRERVLSDLGKGTLDYGKASQALLAAGDTEGGLSLARLAESKSARAESQGLHREQFGFQQQEAQRNEKFRRDQLEFQKAQAEAAAKGFEYREVDDGNGGKSLVRIEKATGAVTRPPIGGQPAEPSNPYAYGKQNENQSKDSGYANRMFAAEQTLRNPKTIEAAKSLYDNSVSKIPVAGNFLRSDAFQNYDQAARDFINATLRRESGAAINASEFDNAYKQYLPRPGDSPEVLAQKQRNRQTTIAGIAGGGGQSYKPPFVFNDAGEMIPSGNPRQGAQKPKEQGAAIDPKAVAELRARARRDPNAAKQFDEVFGAGSAAKALAGQ